MNIATAVSDETTDATDGRTAVTGRAVVYDAFVSYSQKADKAIAQALRSVIQTVGKPWWKVRSLNVFLDATSLSAAPGLWQSIEERLDRSRYLILLASPEAAASKWVDREAAHFIGSDGAGLGRVLIGLTDGNLTWHAAAVDFVWDDATPLPSCLRGRFAEEPLWVDLRPFRHDPARANKTDQAFLHAALDLAATIKGVEKADLYSEEVRRQRRSLRMAYGIAAVVAVLALGAGVAAWVATEARKEAIAQRNEAMHGRARLLTDLARQQNGRANHGSALAYLVEAASLGLPPESLSAPFERELRVAMAENRELQSFALGETIEFSMFSDDRRFIAIGSSTKTSIFDVDDRRVLLVDESEGAGPLRGFGLSDAGAVLVYDRRIRIIHPDDGMVAEESIRAIGETPAVVFSPIDDRFLVVRQRTVEVRSTSDGRVTAELAGFRGGVAAAVFSADGQLIATASADDLGRLWATNSGELLTELEGHDRNVNGVLFNKAGNLVTWSNDGRVIEWTIGGVMVRRYAGEGAIRKVDVSSGGAVVAATNGEGKVWLWNTSTGQRLPEGERLVWSDDGWLEADQAARSYFYPALSHDGKSVVLDGSSVVNLDTGTTVSLSAPSGYGALVSPDGARAAWTDERDIYVWNSIDRGANDLIRLVGHETRVEEIAFTADPAILVSTAKDGTVRYWDVSSRYVWRQNLEEDRSWLSPDAGVLVRGHRDLTRNAAYFDGREKWSFKVPEDDGMGSTTFSPDSRYVGISAGNGAASVWDLQKKSVLGSFPRARMNFSPGSDLLIWDVSGSDDVMDVHVWSLTRSNPPVVIHNATFVSCSPEGDTLLLHDDEANQLRTWDVRTQTYTHTIGDADDVLLVGQFAGNGRLVWSYDLQESIGFVWDIASSTKLWTRELATGFDYVDGPTAFSDRLMAFHSKKTEDVSVVEILDVATGELRGVMRDGWSAQFSPVGDLLTLVNRDGSGGVWTSGGVELFSFGVEWDTLAFLPGGDRIAAASARGARIYDFPDFQELMADAGESVPRALTSAERQRAFLE